MLSAVTLNCRRMGADKLARAVVGARISETNEGYFVHCPTETTPRGPLKSRHEAEKYVCPTHEAVSGAFFARCPGEQDPRGPFPTRVEAEKVMCPVTNKDVLAGSEHVIKESGASDKPLPPSKDYFCVDGDRKLILNKDLQLCEDKKESFILIRGPFPNAMVEACQKKYAGTPGVVCAKASRWWNKDLIVEFRGIEMCPAGSALDAETGLCLDGDFAYGPFNESHVDFCRRKYYGTEICDGLQWSKSVALEIAKKTSPFKYERPLPSPFLGKKPPETVPPSADTAKITWASTGEKFDSPSCEILKSIQEGVQQKIVFARYFVTVTNAPPATVGGKKASSAICVPRTTFKLAKGFYLKSIEAVATYALRKPKDREGHISLTLNLENSPSRAGKINFLAADTFDTKVQASSKVVFPISPDKRDEKLCDASRDAEAFLFVELNTELYGANGDMEIDLAETKEFTNSLVLSPVVEPCS